MESFIKTIRHRDNRTEEREYFADASMDRVRDGWFVLKAKSFKDPRSEGKEIMPSVNIDGLSFKPGTEFQCHPIHAQIVIDLEQVDVVEKPKISRKKSNVAATES